MLNSAPSNSPPPLADALRQAMRGLAKSVNLISTVDENGQRHVMVATAVTPVSMEPPSMLFCINRNASSYPTLIAGADFCINILSKDQLNLAHLCSVGAQGEARFAEGSWMQDDSGVPYLRDAQASVICTQDYNVHYGSHDIFIGLVKDVHLGDEIDPLVFADGEYRRLAQQALSA